MDYYSNILAFDHLKHQIIILSHQGEKQVEELEGKLFGRRKGRSRLFTRLCDGPFILPQFIQEITSSFSHEGFHAAVKQAKDTFLPETFSRWCSPSVFETDYTGDPFNVYRALRFSESVSLYVLSQA